MRKKILALVTFVVLTAGLSAQVQHASTQASREEPESDTNPMLSSAQDCKARFALMWDLPGHRWMGRSQLSQDTSGFCQTAKITDETWVFKVRPIAGSTTQWIVELYRGSTWLEFDEFSLGTSSTDGDYAKVVTAVERRATEEGIRLIQTLFLPPTSSLSPTCQATFLVKWYGRGEGMNATQTEWWEGAGKRKFKRLCWSGDNPADWVIVMQDMNTTVEVPLLEQKIAPQGPNTKTVSATSVAYGVHAASEYRKAGFQSPTLATGIVDGNYGSDIPYHKALEQALQAILKQHLRAQ